MRPIEEIIVHCSATEAGRDIKAAEIRRWHIESNGWKDIGYHYVIDIDGTIEVGRPIDQAGAHTTNHNKTTIGICYVGGLWNGKPKDTRTLKQQAAMVQLIRSLKVCFPSIKKVSGHRDYANKACPCFDAGAAYSQYIK